MPNSRFNFNPNSVDAQLATIISELVRQKESSDERHAENTNVLNAIREQTTKTNGRVSKLENSRKYFLGWIAGASAVGGVVWQLISHFGSGR